MKALFTKLFLIGAVLAMQSAFGQTHSNLYKSFSLGILCGELGYDTGLGIELGHSIIIQKPDIVRMRANENWLGVYKAQYDTWAKYETITASLTYNPLVIERARSYLELGTLYVFLIKRFQIKNSNRG